MSKKIKDLTIAEYHTICSNYECENCPLQQIGCRFHVVPSYFKENELEKDVNEDECFHREIIKLSDYLLHKTDVSCHCVIYESGYEVACCYIDGEDLFIRSLSSSMLDKNVVNARLVKDSRFTKRVYQITVE